jgi:Fe-S cluster assembly scaffold protein SufB
VESNNEYNVFLQKRNKLKNELSESMLNKLEQDVNFNTLKPIILEKNAEAKYISVENWSKNTYNLNTKKCIAKENSSMKWINGNMGSGVTMLYPCSVLRGRGALSLQRHGVINSVLMLLACRIALCHETNQPINEGCL